MRIACIYSSLDRQALRAITPDQLRKFQTLIQISMTSSFSEASFTELSAVPGMGKAIHEILIGNEAIREMVLAKLGDGANTYGRLGKRAGGMGADAANTFVNQNWLQKIPYLQPGMDNFDLNSSFRMVVSATKRLDQNLHK
jgi:hypothetical protein